MKGNASVHTTNAKYREGWERVFGTPQAVQEGVAPKLLWCSFCRNMVDPEGHRWECVWKS